MVWDARQDPARTGEVEAAQARIVEWRSLANRNAPLPSIKAMLARKRGDLRWLNVMPPLVELPETERLAVWVEMDRLGD